MTASDTQNVYGPVPSRRLGMSLGINNIPAKRCTYSCVYCQVGRMTKIQNDRQAFYKPEKLLQGVHSRLANTRVSSGCVDYLTFVPDGEPTLDKNLGEAIHLLDNLDIPIGVITNSSLLWREDVRNELAKADWVSVKIDTVDEVIWRKINRPHKALCLSRILDGIITFSREFTGKLVTETMLVRGVNDNPGCVQGVAEFLHKLQPSLSYISVPTRPPAEKWVGIPNDQTINRTYQLFADRLKRVEILIDYEGDDFAFTSEVEKDLLGITAVHPMRASAVRMLVSRAGASWAVVDRLLAAGKLTKTTYDGHTFYLRKFPKKVRKSHDR